VTKKLGGAVVRNRIRRRLKAAVGLVAPELARANHDYVLVARAAAFERDFDALKKDLERALQRVHHPAATAENGRVR
jgi:ribonuclease P protein component